jgi:hypothetical protein
VPPGAVFRFTERFNVADTFKTGDKIRHAARPEWGVGSVEQATPVKHEGRPAQKLVARFEHQGRVTLHTAFARILHADSVTPLSPYVDAPAPADSTDAWLRELEGEPATRPLVTLPLAATDPLSSLSSRLKATLDLYRFTNTARSITDWAIAQTHLPDPLQRYGREEMHTAFGHFEHNRDTHLLALLRLFKRAEQLDAFKSIVAAHSLPAARQAAARALSAR